MTEEKGKKDVESEEVSNGGEGNGREGKGLAEEGNKTWNVKIVCEREKYMKNAKV